jgi:putative heme degradation protein
MKNTDSLTEAQRLAWKYGFAVCDKDGDGNIRRRLQFFDENGNGIYKILLDVSSNVDAYRAIASYQGHIKQLRSSDARLNILSQDHRLRLREDHIDTVWVAKKPTTNGIVTSLELFNRHGISIARFFSKPEPGRPEPREWRDSIMRLLPVFGA